jgi:hypothetical protein
MKKLIIIIALFISLPVAALNAQTTPPAAEQAKPIAGEKGLFTGLEKACYEEGNCGYCDVLIVINNIITFVLGIIGSVALFVFMMGGAKLVFKPDDKQQGLGAAQNAIKAGIIGMSMVFFSYFAINFVMNVIVGSRTAEGQVSYGVAQLFGKNWSDYCSQ